MTDLEKAGILSSIIVAIIGIISTPYKKLKDYLKRKVELRKLRSEQILRSGDMYKMVVDMKAQFTTNGGTTMKDSLVRMETGIGEIHDRIDHLEEKQKFILNSQNVSFWYSDENGECIYASPNLCKVLRLSESEILGNSWSSNLIKEDSERIYTAWERSIDIRTVFDEIYSFKTNVTVHAICYHRYNRELVYVGSYGVIEKHYDRA